MNFENFSNQELIEFLAKNHGHPGAWKEFIKRFHRFVCYVIYSQSRRIGFKEGMAHVEDLAHDVYIKLLKNESAALKKFQNLHENSIFQFLKIIAIREVLIRSASGRAKKRGEGGDSQSLDAITLLLEMTLKNRPRSISMFELEDTINYCLQKIFKAGEDKERNMLILRFYLFEQLKPDEVLKLLQCDLTSKRASNIIADGKKKLRDCLRENGIGA